MVFETEFLPKELLISLEEEHRKCLVFPYHRGFVVVGKGNSVCSGTKPLSAYPTLVTMGTLDYTEKLRKIIQLEKERKHTEKIKNTEKFSVLDKINFALSNMEN